MNQHVSVLQISGRLSETSPTANYDYLVSELNKVEALDMAVTGELFLARNSACFHSEEFWDELNRVLVQIENLAQEKDMAICVGYPFQGGDGLYIRQSVYFPDALPYHYDKVHLGKNERKLYRQGQKIGTFDFRGLIYGIQICIDTHVAEMTIMQKLAGASVILAPFNTPYNVQKRMENWQKYLPSRAYEYNVCILCQNAGGGSFSCNGKGHVMEVSLAQRDSLLTCVHVDEDYHKSVDYMTYRRPELYKL